MKKFYKYFYLSLAFLIVPFIFVGCFGGFSGGSSDRRTNLDRAVVSISDPNYSRFADGTEKRPILEIKLNGKVYATLNESNSEYTLVYKNNINPGKATCTISATKENKTFKGSNVFEFTIYSATGDVSDFDSLRAALASTSITSVKLTRDIAIPANKSVTIREGVTFSLNGYTLYNNGTIVNNGKIELAYFTSGKKTSVLVNNGTIDNAGENSKIEVMSYCELYVGGTFDNHSRKALEFGSNSKIYSNFEIPSSEISGSGYTFVLRQDINSAGVKLEKDSYFYNGEERKPEVTVALNGTKYYSSDYSATYENNIEVGTARVILRATDKSKVFFGTRTLTFTIEKSTKYVYTSSEIQDALNNPNYEVVAFNASYGKITDEITVPADKTLSFSSTVTISKSMKVYGVLAPKSFLYVDASLHALENGKIEQTFKMFVLNTASVRAKVDGGSVYYNDNNTNCNLTGTAEVHVREKAKLEYFTIPSVKYESGVQHNVTVIANDTEKLPDGTYGKALVDDNDDYYRGKVMDAGSYRLKITISDQNEYYYGTLYTYFIIERISVEVDETMYAGHYIGNNNYDEIIVKNRNSVSAVADDLVVESWQTVTFEEECNNLIYDNIFVKGKLINKGTLNCLWFQDEDGSSIYNLILQEGGSVTNTGTIYLNDCPNNFGGTVYNRKYIGENVKFYDFDGKPFDINNGYWTYFRTYNEKPETPMPVCYYNGEAIESKGEYYFGANPYEIGFKASTLKVSAEKGEVSNPPSKYFYGVYEVLFNVKRGTTTAEQYWQLSSPLKCVDSDGLCKFEKITLTADIELCGDIEIPSNVTIDTAGFNLITNKSGSSTRYFITNHGKILINAINGKDCSFRNEYGSESTGTVEVEVSSLDEFKIFTNVNIASCNFVLKLGDNISITNSDYITIGENIKSYAIDLCGHLVNFIYIWNAKNNVTILSSAENAKIGTGSISDFTEQGSIYVRTLEKNATLTIKTKNISNSGYVIKQNNGGNILVDDK